MVEGVKYGTNCTNLDDKKWNDDALLEGKYEQRPRE